VGEVGGDRGLDVGARWVLLLGVYARGGFVPEHGKSWVAGGVPSTCGGGVGGGGGRGTEIKITEEARPYVGSFNHQLDLKGL